MEPSAQTTSGRVTFDFQCRVFHTKDNKRHKEDKLRHKLHVSRIVIEDQDLLSLLFHLTDDNNSCDGKMLYTPLFVLMVLLTDVAAFVQMTVVCLPLFQVHRIKGKGVKDTSSETRRTDRREQ